ncbi:DUF7933 domain-containing protein [Oleiphilus messinensis]
MAPGVSSTLTYTIDNSANTVPVSSLSFSNSFPAGMTIADPSVAQTTCLDGTYTAIAGSNSVSFTDYRLGKGESCTLSLKVTSSTPGANVNTTGALSSSEGSAGTANATLTVDSSRPGFSMAFSPSSITPGAVSTLTYTIDNSLNGSNSTFLLFSHTLPSGVTTALSPNVSHTCAAGVITAASSSSSISGAGITVNAGTSCDINVDVTASAAGNYVSTTGDLSSQLSPSTPSGAATASLLVTNPFLYLTLPNAASPGSSATLTFDMTNNDFSRDSATGISFTLDLNTALSGLAATSLPSTGFCGAGSTISGTSTLTISNASLATGANCRFDVTVAIPANAPAGAYTLTTSMLNMSIGSATTKPAVSGTLNIQKAPLLTALFIDDPVGAGEDVTLRYTLTNTDTANMASAISFTEVINDGIGGMVVKTLPAANSCGSGSSFSQIFDNNSGVRTLTISNASLAAGAFCTFDYILTVPDSAVPGTYDFTSSAVSGSVSGNTLYSAAATDTLTVVSAPALTLSVTEDSIQPGNTVTAEFTLNYSANAAANATGVGFTVDLNSALTGLTSTTATQSNICGSGSSFDGTSTLTLTGANLAPGDTCTFSVTLQVPGSATPSTITIPSSSVSATVSSKAVISAAASDTLLITGLSFTHQFIGDPALPGSNVTLRYTITNAATASAASAIQFSHSLTGVLNSLTVTGLPPSGCGGTISGTNNLSFSGGTLASGANCSFDVTLLVPAGASAGTYTSTTSAMSATVDANNTTTNASFDTLSIEKLTVLLSTTASSPTTTSPIPVTIAFSRPVVNFVVSDLVVGNGSTSNFSGSGDTYTVDITPTADGTVTIDLPANVVDDSVDNSVKNPAATQLSLDYSSSTPNPTVSISGPSAAQTISGPVSFTVNYTNADQVNLNTSHVTLNKTGTADGSIAVTNGTTNPATVTVSSITGLGTLGISIAPGTGRNGSGNSGAPDPSSTFKVVGAPTLTMVINNDIVGPGQSTTAQFTLTYDANAPDAVTAVGFTVDLDAALSGLVSTSALQSNVCGAGSSVSGTSTITFTGGSLTAGNSCNFSVTLQTPANASPGNVTINTSAVTGTSSSLAVSSSAASDVLTISGLTFSKQFVSDPALPGGTVVLRYTIANSGSALAATGIQFTDNLGAVFTGYAATGTLPTTPCGAGSTISGTGTLSFSGGSLASGGNCSFDVTTLIPASTAVGDYTSTTSTLSATVNSNSVVIAAASDTLTLELLTVQLSTSATTPTSVSPIPVAIQFSRAVTNFVITDLVVANGSASNFAGSGASYTVDITPDSQGAITVDLPAGVVDDAVDSVIKNPAATQLELNYSLTVPGVVISAPSVSSTQTGPVSYIITYSNVTSVNLTNSMITLNRNGTNAVVTVLNGTSLTPTVELSSISGEGTLGISIAAGSALNVSQGAPAAGPSSTFSVKSAVEPPPVDEFEEVFFTPGETITVTSDSYVFGASGTETVIIPEGVSVIADANIEGFQFAKAYSEYRIYVKGSQILVYDGAQSNPTLTLNGVNQATTFIFTDDSYQLELLGLNNAQINGNQIPVLPGPPEFLVPGQTITLNEDATIYGASGTETLVVPAGVRATVDANIERVQFTKNLDSYRFAVAGTVISIYDGSDVTPTVTFLGLNQAISLVFLDGSYELELLGLDSATLGGITLPNTPSFIANAQSKQANQVAGASSLSAECVTEATSVTTESPELTQSFYDVWGEALRASPVVVDLDGDGRNEIIVARGDRVVAWHYDGEVVFNVELTESDIDLTPVVVNLLPDYPGLELAVAAGNKIFAWNARGEALSGFPFVSDQKIRAMLAADVTGDGEGELVVTTVADDGVTEQSAVVAIQANGSVVASPLDNELALPCVEHCVTPVDNGGSNPLRVTAGDINTNEPGLEVLFALNGKIHAISSQSSDLWQYAYDQKPDVIDSDAEASDATEEKHLVSGVTVSDLSNDGVPEILFATYSNNAGETGQLIILSATGALQHSLLLPNQGAMAVPTVADVDGDGLLDIVVNLKSSEDGLQQVLVFKVPGSASRCSL